MLGALQKGMEQGRISDKENTREAAEGFLSNYSRGLPVRRSWIAEAANMAQALRTLGFGILTDP